MNSCSTFLFRQLSHWFGPVRVYRLLTSRSDDAYCPPRWGVLIPPGVVNVSLHVSCRTLFIQADYLQKNERAVKKQGLNWPVAIWGLTRRSPRKPRGGSSLGCLLIRPIRYLYTHKLLFYHDAVKQAKILYIALILLY